MMEYDKIRRLAKKAGFHDDRWKEIGPGLRRLARAAFAEGVEAGIKRTLFEINEQIDSVQSPSEFLHSLEIPEQTTDTGASQKAKTSHEGR